eukprot:5941553-Amphidinium_carterae.1
MVPQKLPDCRTDNAVETSKPEQNSYKDIRLVEFDSVVVLSERYKICPKSHEVTRMSAIALTPLPETFAA